jgi:hypothetical protein
MCTSTWGGRNAQHLRAARAENSKRLEVRGRRAGGSEWVRGACSAQDAWAVSVGGMSVCYACVLCGMWWMWDVVDVGCCLKLKPRRVTTCVLETRDT